MADDLSIDVGIDTGSAASDLNKVASALAGVAGELREAASAAAAYSRSLGSAGTTTSSAQKNAQSATAAIKAQTKATQDLANAQRNLGSVHISNTGTKASTASTTSRPDIGVASKADRDSLNASLFAREQIVKIAQQQQAAIMQVVKANIAESKSAREAGQAYKAQADAMLAAQKLQQKRYATVPSASGRQISDLNSEQLSAAGLRVGSSFGVIEASADKAGTSVQNMNKHLFTARFALNDLSFAAGAGGAALIALNTAAVSAAATYESAMAAIQRTTQSSSDAMAGVQNDFLKLAQTIPGGFDNLARIGELAGQLNVPTNAIASFTENVAKFVSTTDVSVDSATEAFGRLDSLLPDVKGNYEALGSSILNVGINSVATESSIISTTTQIAAAGAAAGLTSSQVIGLAASFASLGIAPEAARGSTIRIFAEIRSAVEGGGIALEEFAKIAGMTSQEFSAAFKRNGAEALTPFLNGLGDMAKRGESAESALRDLGITGVRDINALLRLSQNMDVVNKAFADADSGFKNATALNEAFGITSQTLASKLELLAQSFQGLMATMGEATAGPLKVFVDSLTGLVGMLTDLSKTGFGQFVSGFAALSSVLAAGTLLLIAVTARFGSMAIAVRLTKTELRDMQTEAAATNTRLGALKSGLAGAAISALSLRGALAAVASSTVIGLALTALVTAFDAIGNSMKSAGDVAKETFGSFEELRTALRTDSQNGDDAYGHLAAQLNSASDAANGAKTAFDDVNNVQKVSVVTSSNQAEAINKVGNAYGVATAKALANMIANSEALKEAIKWNAEASKSGKFASFDSTGFITKATQNDIAGARALLDAWRDEQLKSTSFDLVGQQNVLNVYNNYEKILTAVQGALQETTNSTEALAAVSAATGIPVSQLSGDLEDTGNSAQSASDKIQQLRDAVANAFSFENSAAALAQDFYALATSIYENGTAFDTLGTVGTGNLANLQSAVVTTIAAGQAMGLNASQSVAALFNQLQAMGIDTANLLARVAGIGGTSVASIQTAMGAANPQTQALSNYMGEVANRAQAAANAVGGGGGGGGGGLAGGAKKAKEEVRTLLDYASDLAQVWGRAFDIRFGSGKALDTITSALQEVSDKTDQAMRSIQKLNAEIQGLNSDKSAAQYFLGVAEMYGDTLRAADIRAKLADIDSDLADKQADLADEQANASKELIGNSKAAIANRETIRNLARNYQDLIEQYASSGVSQEELAAKAAELKQQFVQQATQLGFNSAQLETYATSFDDVSLAISRVPRNITVGADINPAIQALNELIARASKAGSDAGSGAGSGLSNGIRSAYGNGPYLPPITVPVGYKLPSYSELMRMQETIRTQTGDRNFRIAVGAGGQGGQVFGYAKGGFTGNRGTKDVAGVVHGQEFVVNAENTAKFRPMLEAMNRGQLPMATPRMTAPTIQVVELSAFDRQLLAQAGNVSLNIDGRVVADASNKANFVATSRGSN